MSDIVPKTLHEILRIIESPAEILGIIEGPDFVKMHLANAIQDTYHHSLILTDSDLHLHSADFDALDTDADTAEFQELPDIPFKGTLLGSCNGLLCLLNEDDVIVLWNPSTKNFTKLPDEKIEPPMSDFQMRNASYGFGYDSVNDDYKVVRIVQFLGVSDKEVKVYSLKSDSWKGPRFINSGNGKLANNALHWVMKGSDPSERDGVIAFDLATEEFSLVALPQLTEGKFLLDLGVLKQRLCVVANYGVDEHADIWVREKHGDEYNWSYLISITKSELASAKYFPYYLRPIAYSKCEKRLLLQQDDNLLLWYDLEQRSVTYTTVQNSAGKDIKKFELDIWVHSLVQPNSGNSSDKLESDDSPERLVHSLFQPNSGNSSKKRKSDDSPEDDSPERLQDESLRDPVEISLQAFPRFSFHFGV